ncbi:hypothetical protein Lalb_Chr17g0348571 [Lupinus albus]|uniref:Uncharacterized protein n=1 Tax=Lupinus albus TaxID=3870 RepID=A0A6A4PA27_LUPAL|nr:hypothetical protein Lalb_Chr17g0348571 [Lupinus albus]
MHNLFCCICIGKSDLSKDITEADKLGLENRKWEWRCDIGGSHGFGLNGGANLAVRGINNGDIGKSDLSKDITEADKLGLENRKWEWRCDIGGSHGFGLNGGANLAVRGINNGDIGSLPNLLIYSLKFVLFSYFIKYIYIYNHIYLDISPRI